MKRLAIASLSALAFVACAAPNVPSDAGSGSTEHADDGVVQRLVRLRLPDGWDAYAQTPDGPVKFQAPGTRGSRTDGDALYVFPVAECDLAYANAQTAMNWGEAVPTEYAARPFELKGQTRGYAWDAFDGVGGGATVPGWTHRCVDTSILGLDVDVAIPRDRSDLVEFVEGTFVPLWIAESSKVI